MSHGGAALLAKHFQAVLSDLKVDNYLELVFEGEEGRIVVTLHRPGGKTPGALKKMAELELVKRENQELRRRLVELELIHRSPETEE